MEKKKLGFVILTWNSAGVIEACLRSVLDMHCFCIEIVVVDNGSTDESAFITEQVFAAARKNHDGNLIQIRLGCNKGTTAPRNLGLQTLSRFSPDYYCILDSDTVVNEHAFLRLISELESHRHYGLVGPAMRLRDGSIQNSARAFPTLTEKTLKAIPVQFFQNKGSAMERMTPSAAEGVSLPVDYLISACWLFRPELLERAGYLDEHIFYAPEDAEYCIRVWKAGYQVAYCPEAVIAHEWQRLSRKKYFSRLNWEHIKGLAYMFRKHGYLFSAEKLRVTFQ